METPLEKEKKQKPSQPNKQNSKKVFVKTYGCQMNVYDSQRILDTLISQGYTVTSEAQDADLLLLNTCHIREKAAEKVYSDLGRIRKIKEKKEKEGKKTLIGVTGCVAQAEGEEIIRRAPLVDLVMGPHVIHRLPEILEKVEQGKRVVDIEHTVESKFKNLVKPERKEIIKRGVASFLSIQEGCDKFCSFCVVPYTRGAESSRPVSALVEEATHLAQAGVREITLLGQNVNAWASQGPDGKEWRLGDLLFCLAQIPGIKRLRYTTSHPNDMDCGLIAAHRDLKELMPYLHLPAQSGSNRILKAMNRRYTVCEYKRVIDKVRNARPDIAISGDFIVGFPEETEEDFKETLQLVRDVEYASAFSFKYSARPGTPASQMLDTISLKRKDERLQELQSLLMEQRIAFSQSLVGTTFETLLEKPGREPNQIVGRSPWLQPVVLNQKVGSIGDIVSVIVTKADINALYAKAAEI